VGVICLAGCEFLDMISDLIGGDGTGGGGIGGVTFTRVIVEYGFATERMRRADVSGDPPTVEPWDLSASLSSIGQLVFDPATTTYTAQTPIDSDPYILFSIRLDASGSMITYLDAYRRMTFAGGGWEKIERIIVENIPYDRVEGLTTFYRIDADNVGWAGLQYTDYRSWSTAVHTEQDPMYWIADPTAMQADFDADPDRYIEISFEQ
jgi:hypothetical protein